MRRPAAPAGRGLERPGNLAPREMIVGRSNASHRIRLTGPLCNVFETADLLMATHTDSSLWRSG